MNTAHQIYHLLKIHECDEDAEYVPTMKGESDPQRCKCGWKGTDHLQHQTRMICSIDAVWTPEWWWREDRPEIGGWKAGPGPNEEIARLRETAFADAMNVKSEAKRCCCTGQSGTEVYSAQCPTHS